MSIPTPGSKRPTSDTTHALSAPPQHETAEVNLHAPSNPAQGRVVKPLPTNIPLPRSHLIGRDHEIAAVQHLLLGEEVFLLTLTGPGGIGKTRLALQVAAQLLDHFIDGVYFISLAPIREANLVGVAIGQALGLREVGGRPMLESLQEHLQHRQVLLVLDNFEQVMAAAPFVAELLANCRRLKILVTSRATLHLYGEQEYPVPPLALPDAKRLSAMGEDLVSDLAQVAAVALFVQRAQAAKPDCALTATNAASVAKICISLDGIPLAIELAAAKIKLFAPPALLARLQQRLTLLTGGAHDLPARQRTLRAEIDWSYHLLAPGEQALFRRLAVFAGGFMLEAAQAVGLRVHLDTGEPAPGAGQAQTVDVLDGVASLLDQNLLRQGEGPDGEPRFWMLETIREYALEQLDLSGEAETIRRHHADFFLALAETTEPELLGAQRERGLAHLQVELDNLRAALDWSQTPSLQDGESRIEVGLRLAGSLAWFAHFGNHFHEARGWLVAILQRVGAPTAARAKALWGAGLMAMILGDFPIARAELGESVAIWRTIGVQYELAVALRELSVVAYCQRDFSTAQRYAEESVGLWRGVDSPWDLALALDSLGYTLGAQGDLATARTLFEEEVALYQALNDTWGLTTAMSGLGWIAGQQGDYTAARMHVTEALALRRAKADKWTIAQSLSLLGEVLQRQGELEQASHLYGECLMLASEVSDKGGMALVLYNLGTLAQLQRQHERAARLFAAVNVLHKVTGGASYHTLTTPPDQERVITTVRTRLGEELFAACWAEGQVMTLEQAIAYALAAPQTPEGTPSTSEDSLVVLPRPIYPAGLTAREVEVLQLVALGHSYAEVAEKLVISRRTVNAHLTSIYSKLDVTSRQQRRALPSNITWCKAAT